MRKMRKMKRLVEIKSPADGIFIAADGGLQRNECEEPFVKIGDSVEPETIVCEIQSTKNRRVQIEAGLSGKIKRILIKDGQEIKRGHVLFLVRP